MITTASHPVSMISVNFNIKPVIDVRRRWEWRMRSSFAQPRSTMTKSIISLTLSIIAAVLCSCSSTQPIGGVSPRTFTGQTLYIDDSAGAAASTQSRTDRQNFAQNYSPPYQPSVAPRRRLFPFFSSPSTNAHVPQPTRPSGSIFGRLNPANPFSEYSSPFGRYNPSNPFSEVSSPFGELNKDNPFSEVSSPFGKYNPSNPFSEVSSPFGKYNPNNPFSEGVHPATTYGR